jgi:uncharacterized protein (DUF433 family)
MVYSSDRLSIVTKILDKSKYHKFMFGDSKFISRSPDVMGGITVFSNTRVPVQTLLDYLKAGESIDDFLDGFPTVTREQVIYFLEELGRSLLSVAA